jgi:hypothetical protein
MFKAIFIIITFLASHHTMAQLQAQTLEVDSLYNNRTFLVESRSPDKTVRLRVRAVYRGEPAALPMEVQAFIQCDSRSGYRPIDLMGQMQASYGDRFRHMQGRPTEPFPSGTLHVCALENVNMDQNRFFITLFKPGSNHCDRSRVQDLIFPISAFCGR